MLALTLAALLFAPAPAPADMVVWSASVESALEQARRESKPIFIAINMDGERANNEMVAIHYQHALIRELTGHTVNLFASRFDHGSGTNPCPRAGSISCAEHMLVEKEVRNLFLEGEARQNVIAPQHLFVSDEGVLLHSVPYQISVGELEWCLVRALKKVDPEFSWKLSGPARAPHRLVIQGLAEADDEELGLIPDRDEVTAILEELKKVGRGQLAPGVLGQMSRLIRSEDKRAMDYVASMLKSQYFSLGDGRRLELCLHGIGQSSPSAWWRVVEPFLSDHRLPVRSEAAVALEQLAEPASLSALLKQWRREQEPQGRKELIRAIARVGSDDRKASALVEDLARKGKSLDLRVCAVIAAAALDDREAVLALAKEALVDEQAAVRAAAAYVIAVRRETEFREPLADRALLETDPEAKAVLEGAIEVLDGLESSRLDAALRRLTGSRIPRDRR